MLQLIFDAISPQGRNTKLVAELLLKKFRRFGRVVNASESELRGVDGVGQPEIMALKTVAVAVYHMLRQSLTQTSILYDSDDLNDYLMARLQDERVEVCFIMYLDSGNHLIEDEELCRGTLDSVPFYPREVIRRCLELDAKSVILAHNHPSGLTKPSYQDIMHTQGMIDAMSLFGIVLIDHVIVGNGKTLSFRKDRLI